MPYDHIAIIYNPNSTGDAEKNAKTLQSAIRLGMSIEADLVPTEHAGHATDLAYDIAKAHEKPLIISASGDGGYNEVINGALRAQSEGSSPICAVLPSGNANDHARTMHGKPLPELIMAHSLMCLDVLRVDMTAGGVTQTRYAHSYVGLGVTPAVAHELDKNTDHASMTEALTLMRTLWTLDPIEVRRAGEAVKLDSIVCSIIPEMAKVFTLSDKALPNDGKFELATIPHGTKLHLVQQLARGVFASLSAHSRETEFTCTVLEDAHIQFDGEVISLAADTDITVTICPGELRTIAEIPPANPEAKRRAKRTADSPKLTKPFRDTSLD